MSDLTHRDIFERLARQEAKLEERDKRIFAKLDEVEAKLDAHAGQSSADRLSMQARVVKIEQRLAVAEAIDDAKASANGKWLGLLLWSIRLLVPGGAGAAVALWAFRVLGGDA